MIPYNIHLWPSPILILNLGNCLKIAPLLSSFLSFLLDNLTSHRESLSVLSQSQFLLLQLNYWLKSTSAPATDGRCSLSNLGFNLGFFELVISFTVQPHSQGHLDRLTKAHAHAHTHTHTRARAHTHAAGNLLLCSQVSKLMHRFVLFPASEKTVEIRDSSSRSVRIFGLFNSLYIMCTTQTSSPVTCSPLRSPGC